MWFFNQTSKKFDKRYETQMHLKKIVEGWLHETCKVKIDVEHEIRIIKYLIERYRLVRYDIKVNWYVTILCLYRVLYMCNKAL